MPKSYQAVTADISEYTKQLLSAAPETMKGFYDMAAAATKDNVLSKKVKEYIALAIGVSTRWDGCIGFHTRTLVDLGATCEEVTEVLGMAVYMGGGPSLMYAADPLRAFDEFLAVKKA